MLLRNKIKPTGSQVGADADFGRRKPRIGLALSSGAARGLAHVGVIQALEELKVPVYAVAD
jgi:predicted acylesterase/phospholipase RssA